MNPKQIGNRLGGIVPGQEALTLTSLSSSGSASVSIPRARRRPLTRKDQLTVGANVGETWVKFQIYVPSTAPKVGDKLTDASGVVYEIREVEARTVHDVYNPICIQDRT